MVRRLARMCGPPSVPMGSQSGPSDARHAASVEDTCQTTTLGGFRFARGATVALLNGWHLHAGEMLRRLFAQAFAEGREVAAAAISRAWGALGRSSPA